MAVGVTILLSLAVFFLMVEEKMPVSENLPLIGKYYCSTIIEVSLSLAAMCYVLWFVHHRPRSLPVWKRVNKEVILFKVAQNSFQQLDFDGSLWPLFICSLMLQSWYQKTAQSLMNTLLSFS